MSLILEASGWALNVNMKVNRRIGRVFTFTPPLPPGSVKERLDVLRADEKRPRWVIPVVIAAVVAIAAVLVWWLVFGFALPSWLGGPRSYR
jgi:hypothetical protein